MAPRGGALLRPVPEGPGHRHPGRAPVRGVRARVAPPGAGPRRSARGVAVRGGLADRAHQGSRAPPPAEPRARRAGARGGPALAPERAHQRHRGGRPRHVVRRRGPRPAPHRRLEPHLRQRAAPRGPGDPRTAQGAAAGLGRRAARPVVRALERRGPRRHRHPGGPGRPERGPPRVRRVPEGPGARPRVPPRDRDALHLLGVPQGSSPALRGEQRPVADAVADPLSRDHHPSPGPGHAPAPARGPAREPAEAELPPPGRGRPRPARLRHPAGGDNLGVRRDLTDRARCGQALDAGDRHQRRREALSLGREPLRGEDHPRDHGRSAGHHFAARRVPQHDHPSRAASWSSNTRRCSGATGRTSTTWGRSACARTECSCASGPGTTPSPGTSSSGRPPTPGESGSCSWPATDRRSAPTD